MEIERCQQVVQLSQRLLTEVTEFEQIVAIVTNQITYGINLGCLQAVQSANAQIHTPASSSSTPIRTVAPQVPTATRPPAVADHLSIKAKPTAHKAPSRPTVTNDAPAPADIIEFNSDYLTYAQALAYTLSLQTPRGNRAVTEPFIFEGMRADENAEPLRVSCTVTSLKSSGQYKTTLTSCSCPDHRSRRLPCKHMIALAIKVNAIIVDAEELKKRK